MSRRLGKKGQNLEALGSFSTKIHLKTNWNGNPLGFHQLGRGQRQPAL
jgi:hypothetical protein